MISAKMEKALNEQINAEAFSAYLYMSMSAYFKSCNLPGFAHWMDIQAHEEYLHSRKFYDYVIQRGGKVKLAKIDSPDTEWESPLAVFEAALKHEQYITSRINSLVDLSIKEKDHAAGIFLHWFVTEQVEEEENAGGIVEQLKLIADSKSGIFMLDRELGQRQPPAAGAGADAGAGA